MPWGKDKTPEELFVEMFGKPKSEFDAELAAARESAGKTSSLEAKQTETETTIATLQAELAALKSKNETTKEPTNWFVNPDAALAERLAPTANAALTAHAAVAELSARQKYDKDFRKWGSEIEEVMKSHGNLSDKTNPTFYENVVNMVRGRHAAEIEESALKGNSYFTEQPGGATIGGAEDKDFNLTKEQLAAAKRMNMSPKEMRDNLDYVSSNYGHNASGVARVN